jgi:hypothetical protein
LVPAPAALFDESKSVLFWAQRKEIDMRCSRSLLFSVSLGWLALGVVSASAQQSSQPTILIVAPSSVCPVGLRAQHGTDGGLVAIRNAGRHQTGQSLRVTVTNTHPVKIVGVQLTVHGVTDKPQLKLAGAPEGADANIARTVDLQLDVAARKDASAGLSLPRFTAVLYLDLDAVTYADGSSWHARTPGSCRVQPDLFMLTDAQPQP